MGKFTNPYTLALRLFGVQLIVTAAAILFLPTFGAVVASNLGTKIYSSVTALMFFAAYHSTLWEAGKTDAKHVKVYNKHKEDKIALKYSKPVIVAILAAVPNIIALSVLTYAKITGNGFDIVNMIYRILQGSFLGWLGNDNLTYVPNCYIVTLIPMLLAFPAYYAGTKEFSIMEKYLPKIIYKKQPKKESKKKNK